MTAALFELIEAETNRPKAFKPAMGIGPIQVCAG
jgi:hypothetical protein